MENRNRYRRETAKARQTERRNRRAQKAAAHQFFGGAE